MARGSRSRSRDHGQHSGYCDTRAPQGCACTTWQRSICCRGSQTPLRRWRLVLRTASNQHSGPGQAPCGSTRRSTQVLATELLREELSREPCASGRLQACSWSPPLTLLRARGHSLQQPPPIRTRDTARPTCLFRGQPARACPSAWLRHVVQIEKKSRQSESCRAPMALLATVLIAWVHYNPESGIHPTGPETARPPPCTIPSHRPRTRCHGSSTSRCSV